MKYYKFIKGMKIYSKHGVIEFIENELKTENELNKILGSFFDRVVITANIHEILLPKNQVYFSFGVRKQITNNL